MKQLLSNIIVYARKMWKTILLVFAGCIMLAWMVLLAVAPLQKKMELQQLVENDTLFTRQFEDIYNHPDMHLLVKEKYYREALLKLSGNDSIQLVVNLNDSSIELNIRGVVIHQTRIDFFSRDKLLEQIPPIQEAYLFSRPLPVIYHYSTIVKEPIVVRHAPSESAEAVPDAWEPDTLIQHPAFVAFWTEHNLRIILEQDIQTSLKEHWTRSGFYTHLFLRKTILSLRHLICFEKQTYQPAITIRLPVNDLRAIYRALPEQPYVVLKL